MSIAQTVRDYLTEHHVEFEPIPHTQSSTSRESAHAAHVREDHVAKAVLLKDAQGYAMAVIPGSHWVKLEALRDQINRDFALAEEDEADNLFADCQSGAIPPLGPAYGIETFVDDELMSLANVYFEAGDHIHLVQVDGDAFHELLKGVRHGHFSHNQAP